MQTSRLGRLVRPLEELTLEPEGGFRDCLEHPIRSTRSHEIEGWKIEQNLFEKLGSLEHFLSGPFSRILAGFVINVGSAIGSTVSCAAEDLLLDQSPDIVLCLWIEFDFILC